MLYLRHYVYFVVQKRISSSLALLVLQGCPLYHLLNVWIQLVILCVDLVTYTFQTFSLKNCNFPPGNFVPESLMAQCLININNYVPLAPQSPFGWWSPISVALSLTPAYTARSLARVGLVNRGNGSVVATEMLLMLAFCLPAEVWQGWVDLEQLRVNCLLTRITWWLLDTNLWRASSARPRV